MLGLLQIGRDLVVGGVSEDPHGHHRLHHGGKPVNQAAVRPEILFEDFEHGYGNWTVEGEAFGKEPAHGTLPNQQRVSGFLGQGLVNTFFHGDDTLGRLVSKPFTIERRFIRFLIGGQVAKNVFFFAETENGIEDARDTLRPRYMAGHVYQMWRAVNFNQPVKGYFWWSLVDNFEWERGWSQRFGLWEVEPDTQARHKRPSADLYAEICKENGLTSDMVKKYCPEVFEEMFPG